MCRRFLPQVFSCVQYFAILPLAHCFVFVCLLCFIRIHLKRKATEQSGGKKKKQKMFGKQKSSQRNPATKKGGKKKNNKQFTKKPK